MSKLLLVWLGGAIGSGARYLVGSWVAATWGTDFPWGTLTINATGSFLISVVMFLALEVGMIRARSSDCSSRWGSWVDFTTYSSFNHETLSLAQRGQWGLAAAYVGPRVSSPGWPVSPGSWPSGRPPEPDRGGASA